MTVQTETETETIAFIYNEETFEVTPNEPIPIRLQVLKRMYGKDYLCHPSDVSDRRNEMLNKDKLITSRKRSEGTKQGKYSRYTLTFPDGTKTELMKAKDLSIKYNIYPGTVLARSESPITYTFRRPNRKGWKLDRIIKYTENNY